MPRGVEWPAELRAEFERRWHAGETKGQIRAAMGLTVGQVTGSAGQGDCVHPALTQKNP